MQAMEGYARQYWGVVDDPNLSNWPSPLQICAQTIQHIKDFRVSTGPSCFTIMFPL